MDRLDSEKILVLETTSEIMTKCYETILGLVKLHKEVELDSIQVMTELLDILSEVSMDSLMYIKLIEGQNVNFEYHYDTIPKLEGDYIE